METSWENDMLDKKDLLECVVRVNSLFHVYNLKKMVEDSELKPVSFPMEEIDLCRPDSRQDNAPKKKSKVPPFIWCRSTGDVGLSAYRILNFTLDDNVARVVLKRGLRDLECVRGAMYYMGNIWREYEAYSKRLWNHSLADIGRFMYNKTGIGYPSCIDSLNRGMSWDAFSIGGAFVDARGADEFTREFFESGRSGIASRFSDSVWAYGESAKIPVSNRMNEEMLNICWQLLPSLQKICEGFLQTGLPINEYAFHKFFPEVYIDPLMYVDDECEPLKNLARKIVNGSV